MPGAGATPAQGAELLDSPRHRGCHGQRAPGRKKGPKWPSRAGGSHRQGGCHESTASATHTHPPKANVTSLNVPKSRELQAGQSCCPKGSAAISELKQQQGLQNPPELGCWDAPDYPTQPWLPLGRNAPACTLGSWLSTAAIARHSQAQRPQEGQGSRAQPLP